MKHLESLSDVFPEGSTYFYGYPAAWDEDSCFLNTAPLSSETIVAGRPLVCAGDSVNVLVYTKTVQQKVLEILEHELGTLLTQRRIVLPEAIGSIVDPQEFNQQMKNVLSEFMKDESFIMAQPLIDPRLTRKYLTNPDIGRWANDKDNMREFFPEEYLIPELGRANCGDEFSRMDPNTFPYPCVVKLSSSGGGDGVRICKSPSDFIEAQKTFAPYNCPILVLKFIHTVKEIGAKFAIHPDATPRFSRIGATSDFSSRSGEWVGSLIGSEDDKDMIEKMYAVLETSMLPKLHQKGWRGIGEGGALIDADGRLYFSDCNCRMTADMPQTFQMNQNLFPGKQLVVFNGVRPGSLEDFSSVMKPIAQRGTENQIMNVVAIGETEEGVKVHGGILFDQEETLIENIAQVQRLGIRSGLFERLQEKN